MLRHATRPLFSQRLLAPFVFALLIILAGGLTAGRTHAQTSAVFEYDLGDATVIQERFPTDSRFYNMPVTLRGVIGVPEGDGPFPVALFIHGAYPFCSAPLVNEMDVYPCPPDDDLRQYAGFSYLAEVVLHFTLVDSGTLLIADIEFLRAE